MLFIPIDQLKSGLKLAYDVVVFEKSNVRLLPRGSVLTDRFIDGLKRFGINGVYVRDEITGDIQPSKPVMSTKLKTKTLTNLEWMFNNTEKSNSSRKKHIEHVDKTVLSLIDLVKENQSQLVNISDLKAYDEYTYHHSLSVAVVSLAIGVQLGFSHEELHKLGFGAIMHDIGKMSVPIEIINKPASLTHEEFDIVKKHPENSEDYLTQNDIDDPEIYESVISHHEKIDGTGYPRGLTDKAIHYYGKIISVADVYDALTSNRPYRKALLPSEVAEYMMGNVDTAFDLGIVKAFLQKIEFFPIGSFVEFNNGSKGIVISNENSLHPVVKLLDPPYKILDLFNDSSTFNLVIVKHFDSLPSSALAQIAL